ncbi:ATPase with chaperone activity, ATP-binding subunit [Treponema sp. JC4]|uniref:ATP-dependent Clp protease ATP-binding subunit n=1 Tax=Treponema sp. JC4 TaxID=1124982 RepID=UPI00025AFBD0|nr:ATP-dependent Clp protease ATP-binding subunit [Treponema sp. JC4]EID85416.1 ATPase with chaperone activity, ATP-binding subunit [Treponema sp. JC4]
MKNFSLRARKIVLILAQDEARQLGSKEILPEHVLLAMLRLKEGIGFTTLTKLNVNLMRFEESLEDSFATTEKTPTLDQIPQSQRLNNLLRIADYEATALSNSYVGTEHLLLAAVKEAHTIAENFFTASGYTVADVRFTIMEAQSEVPSSYNDFNLHNYADEFFKSIFGDDPSDFLLTGTAPEEDKKNQKEAETSDGGEESFLSEYSRDLTKMARENKSDPVVGRDKEIHRVIQILSRRTKNNPVLTGEPGVGKTAIVEGLAQAITAGKVPSNLLKKRILSLDLAAMVAGTKYRGEFEERMKKMMKEVQENDDIILFIDELHTIIGAGGPEGTMDASNIMKPALSRGEIQIIGATTTKEYTRHIEKDLALERRFQVVKVSEPSDEETIEILRGIKQKYENFHHVVYEDDVMPAIVKLSRRYIPEKVLPDKAIDILDEAGASKKISEEQRPAEFTEIEANISDLIEEKKSLVKNQDYENAALVRDKVIELKRKLGRYSNMLSQGQLGSKKTVTVSDIEKIICEMTGIPVEQLTTTEIARIMHMEEELHNTVIGQDDAVSVISGAIRRSRAGISSPKHPVGSFIFLGPTGVGKTQLAKALAKYLFGSEDSLIRIDMSDFMEKHTASRLVGAPPGYVGYEDGGILTEKVRRHPYSVVLLDEIEKAHPDIFNLLLQLLEEGELSDNLGHTVNFRNTVIIMTSNAGARQITNEGRVGFGTLEGVMPYQEIKSGAMHELKKLLNPELINRIDDVIVFNALSKAEISKILDIQIKDLADRISGKNLTIKIDEDAKSYLIEHGYNPAMGARPMKRLIRKEIEDPLAMAILENSDKKLSCVYVELKDGKLNITLGEKEKEPVLQLVGKKSVIK